MAKTLLPAILIASALWVSDAADPAWWTDRGVTAGGAASNYAPVNLGQMAAGLHAGFEDHLPGGPGFDLTDLFPAPPGPLDPGYSDYIAAQYALLDLGHPKFLAQPCYDRLRGNGVPHILA